MDAEWMRQKLMDFSAAASRYDYLRRAMSSTARADARGALFRAQPTARRILEEIEPGLAAKLDVQPPGGAAKAVGLVNQALGILDDRAEWEIKLGPTAPTLAADQFHHWVWQAAKTLWDNKHYRLAVGAAATAISAHTQTKLGRRDISDDDLMNQAFTEKPKRGHSYLRLPGDPADLTIRSRNNALRPFAQGCFAGIRNPSAHEHGEDWDQQKALEQLAALSVLARWIDECDVLSGE